MIAKVFRPGPTSELPQGYKRLADFGPSNDGGATRIVVAAPEHPYEMPPLQTLWDPARLADLFAQAIETEARIELWLDRQPRVG